LAGNGKSRRHIKLRTVDDLLAKKLEQYTPLAVAAAKGAA
jgi:hypothetical protein